MNSDWKRLVPTEDHPKVQDLLDNATYVTLLLQVIDKLAAHEEKLAYTLTTYDSPSWAYKQADFNGAQRAYLRMRALLQDSKTNG